MISLLLDGLNACKNEYDHAHQASAPDIVAPFLTFCNVYKKVQKGKQSVFLQ